MHSDLTNIYSSSPTVLFHLYPSLRHFIPLLSLFETLMFFLLLHPPICQSPPFTCVQLLHARFCPTSTCLFQLSPPTIIIRRRVPIQIINYPHPPWCYLAFNTFAFCVKKGTVCVRSWKQILMKKRSGGGGRNETKYNHNAFCPDCQC